MTARVFISSTFEDLQEERKEIQNLVSRFPETQFVGMEDFGARDETPLETSLQELDRCQLYIGIFGGRYGSGITEREYLRAQDRNLPCRIYWKRGDSIRPDAGESAEQQQRRESLRRRLHERHTVQVFDSTVKLIAAVAADLHRFLFERMTSAVKSLRPPHANRVRKFVQEYVGSPESMVPFGGRRVELEKLDAWLGDPDGSPYCLLVAPAGRGKSALLVHWSNDVAARDERAVLFFPISIRYATNQEAVASAYLRGRFSELHEEPSASVGIVDTIDETLDAYLSRSLAHGKELLLVLDGIDEAADWEPGQHLFPRRPASGVRVVVSARARPDDVGHGDWRRQLGWEERGLATVFDLGPLGRDGIEDVLGQAKIPDVPPALRGTLVDEVHRLTRGDPLLVGLYLEEISLGARVDSLTNRPPGLDAFLRAWWKDQVTLWQQRGEPALFEKTASLVLGLLACSLGPLRRDEILQLTADDHLTSANVEAVLPGLSRLVIGDGDQLPYAFGHPEFARYYSATRLTETEREAFEARFLAWGRETIRRLAAGELPPERVPIYLVRYYGAHLEQSRPEETIGLLTADWRRAWYVHEGEAYRGFLADVGRTLKVARALNRHSAEREAAAPLVGARVRCALYQNSIRSRRAMTPATLVALCLEHGVLAGDQSLASVRTLPDPIKRAEGLAEIVPHLHGDQREEAVEEAFEIARGSGSAWLVNRLAPFLGARLPDALEMATAFEDWELIAFLRAVAPSLPPAMLDQARQLTESLDGLHLVQALDFLIDRLPARDRPPLVDAMNSTVAAMPSDGKKVFALCHLSRHRPEAVEEALAVSEDILGKEDYFSTSGGILATLVPRLDPARHWERAWKLYQSAEKNIENAVIAAIALARQFPGAASEVRRLAILHGPASRSTQRDWILRKPEWEAILVLHLPLSERGDLPSRHLKVLVSTGASKAPWSTWTQATSLRLLAQLSQEQAVECLDYAAHVESDTGRALVLGALLRQIPEAERRVVLRNELDRPRIRDESDQVTAMSMLVAHAPQPRRAELAELVRIAASRMSNDARRNRVIARIAGWLARDADLLIREAFGQVTDIEHDFSRSDALAALAPCLPEDLYPAAIDQALDLLTHSDFAASNALFGRMSGEQRARAFDGMMERIEFLMTEMRWSLDRLVGSTIPLLSDDQLERVLQLSTSVAEWDRVNVLLQAVAARRLSRDQVQESLNTVRGFDCAASRVRGLAALLPFLSDGSREVVRKEAHQASRLIEDNPGRRARALTDLLAAAGSLDRQVLVEAMEAAEEIEEASARAAAFKALLLDPRLSRTERLDIFERVLESAAGSKVAGSYGRVRYESLGRGLLLQCIGESAEAIASLGGESAVEESLHAIRDAAAWWP